MINNKEIQIGNFVKDRRGNVIKIDFIEYLEEGYSTKFGMYQEEKDSEWFGVHPLTEYTDFAEPIEISVHWFVKLGFEELEKNEIDGYLYLYFSKHIKDDLYLDISFNHVCNVFSLKIIRVIHDIRKEEVFYLPNNFKYVHHLQNFINSLS